MDQHDVVVFQCLFEFGAGNDVVVALPPGGSVVGMIDGDGLHLGVVVSEVNDQLSEAGLQILDEVQIKVFPSGGRNVWARDQNGIEHDVFIREERFDVRRSLRTERCEKRELVFMCHLDVSRGQVGRAKRTPMWLST